MGSRHEQVAAGLRELADFIAVHPDLPLPKYPAVTGCPGSDIADDEAFAQVAETARILGVDVDTVGTNGTHAAASRKFGGVTFRMSHVARGQMDSYHAALSYEGNVQAEGGER